MRRIARKRRLTADEAAKYRKVREQVEQELPELVARHHERSATLEKLETLFPQLKAAREARGLSLAALTELTGIDRAEPIAIDFKIDVNRADWPELALMPNIGEQLAKRIVTDRTERGQFHDLAELRRVRGIGPKTLESMKPFLLPLPDLDATA